MRIALRLEPAAVRVDAIQLAIPMKTAETWLMHPVTDLLRHHYAGRIPDGQGRLWDYGGKLRDVKYTETGGPDADGKVWDSRHAVLAVARPFRALHLARWPRAGHLLVRRE